MERRRATKPFPNEYRNQSEIRKATIMPTSGARKINSTVFNIGSGLTDKKPELAMAAPANPPMSVCDEEEGIPNHQVSRFQVMAAISPAKTTFSMVMPSTTSGLTVLATVLATPWSLKIKKAAKLKMAAHTTA